MARKTSRVAFCGLMCALCLCSMLLVMLVPMADYACPALAGILLIVPVIEYNRRTALIAYIATAILSLIILPNKESAVIFTAFLGYYPILKHLIEQSKSTVMVWVWKLVSFNIALAVGYLAITFVFGWDIMLVSPELVNSTLGKVIPIVLPLLLNVAFIVYDKAISAIVLLYMQRLRPKLKFLK